MKKLFYSLKNVNYKMFVALLVLGLMPTLYTTLRVFFIGNLPGEWAFSIAGQLSWIDLIFEIVSEAIILPLYFFIGKAVEDKKDLTNRVKTGMLITFAIYTLFAVLVIALVKPLLMVMATSPDIIEESATYIRIECIAYIFQTLLSFALVVLVTTNKEKYLYIFMGIKLALSVLLDTFLVSTLKCSAHLGVNGIGVSNIISGVLLLASVIYILHSEGVKFSTAKKCNLVG